jgi:hypothetical protein
MAEGKLGGHSSSNVIDLSKEATYNIIDSFVSILGMKKAFFTLRRGDRSVLARGF